MQDLMQENSEWSNVRLRKTKENKNFYATDRQ